MDIFGRVIYVICNINNVIYGSQTLIQPYILFAYAYRYMCLVTPCIPKGSTSLVNYSREGACVRSFFSVKSLTI